jgi:threonine/homoserine/homoserine lactone efflux protein
VERRFLAGGGKFEAEKTGQTGLLFAAGLIAGESILGVLLAIPIVVSGNADVLAVSEAIRPGQWAGAAALAVVGWWMYRASTAAARR